MQIQTDFKNNDFIPVKYTVDGQNINPEIKISNIPQETKSIALIVDDPDAARVAGFTWIHWVAFNIPVDSSELKIEENSTPGIQIKNSNGIEKYSGPSPPPGSGVHNYFFKVFALDEKLDSNINSLEKLKEEITKHKIDYVEIAGKYTRDQNT